jgi:hypothetical protein
MRKQGYRHSTVRYCIQALKSIARHASLLQPESAKAYLASAEMSESRKAKLTEDLARFYAYNHLAFDKPNYRRVEKLPFVPLEVEVDQLILILNRPARRMQFEQCTPKILSLALCKRHPYAESLGYLRIISF